MPNITNMEELEEYTFAPETPDVTVEEMERLDDLWEHGFYLEEATPTAAEAT